MFCNQRLPGLRLNCQYQEAAKNKSDRGVGQRLRYAWVTSLFGRCLVVADERGLYGMAFVDSDEHGMYRDMTERWPSAQFLQDETFIAHHTAPLTAMGATGQRQPDAGEISVILSGTQFQHKVWEALLQIPLGEQRSYRQIAAAVGTRDHARAVGGALASNPLAWLVPCHCVRTSAGELGGYRWGRERKKALLDWEASVAATS